MARRPHRSPGGPSSQGFGRSVASPPDTGVWEIDSRPIAARVQADDGSWYQPSVLLVVEASGLVRAIQPDHANARLAPLLPGVPLRQGRTPLLDEALLALAQTTTPVRRGTPISAVKRRPPRWVVSLKRQQPCIRA